MLSFLLSTLRSVLLGSGLGLGMLSILATVGLANGWDLQGLVALAMPLPFGPLVSLGLIGLSTVSELN